MEGHPLRELTVRGFKSLRDQKIEFHPLNILIGANGSGKSNFIEVFRLLHALEQNRLRSYTREAGGADSLLHHGGKVTEQIEIAAWFGPNGYACTLQPDPDDLFFFSEEVTFFHDTSYLEPYDNYLGSAHQESRLGTTGIDKYIRSSFKSWQLYHFHDVGRTAHVKKTCNVNDNQFLRPDAANLAAFLLALRENFPDEYRNIVDTIRLAAPFFDDFILEPVREKPDTLRLEWRERDSEKYFNAHDLSDGTLRFICIATLLMQPRELLPSMILLDEPELGLHPYAIALLADLLSSASESTRVLAATQSVNLIDHLELEHLIVADREGGETSLHRPDPDFLRTWLSEYSLGQVWEKNLMGGRPGR